MEDGGAVLETFRGVVFPWHCDMMGHMSVQHQMPLLDNAVFHLLGEFGPSTETVGGHRFGWADVAHEIRYRHEINAGDLLVLKSGILSVGKTSLRHRTLMFRRSDGLACTILEGVTVRFDLDVRTAAPLEERHRRIAARLTPPELP